MRAWQFSRRSHARTAREFSGGEFRSPVAEMAMLPSSNQRVTSDRRGDRHGRPCGKLSKSRMCVRLRRKRRECFISEVTANRIAQKFEVYEIFLRVGPHSALMLVSRMM